MENIPVQPPAPIPAEKLRSGDETLNFVYPCGIKQCTWTPGADKRTSPHVFKPPLEKPKILPNVLFAIGNTPLIRLNNLPKSYGIKCEMLAKCEYFNPSGSVKDRIALNMILNAEERGLLKPGDRIIESTAGNTGLGLAMGAAVKGYKCTCVMPLRMSNDKADALRALGAEVVRTPKADLGTKDCVFNTAQRICKETPNSLILDQFRNACNPIAHYESTAEEILYQCDGKVDAIVCGAGTGGTMTGIGRKMKEKCPSCKMIGADPIGSSLAEPEELNKTEVTFFEMEGIGFNFLPTTLVLVGTVVTMVDPVMANILKFLQGCPCHLNLYSIWGSVVSEWYKVSDKESMIMARKLVTTEGILCGGSSGTAMCAAIKAAQKMKEGERLVVILPDGMRNYMTKFVSDPWMKIRDFIGIDEENRWSFLPAKVLDLKKPSAIPFTTTCGAAIEYMSTTNQNYIFIEKDGTILGTIMISKMLNNLMEMKYTFEHTVDRIVDSIRTVDDETPLGKICAIIQVETFVLIETQSNQKDQSRTEKITKYATADILLSFISKHNYSATN